MGSNRMFYSWEFSRWWFISGKKGATILFIVALFLPYVCSDESKEHGTKFHHAEINITYIDVQSKKEVFKQITGGKYGKHSVISSVSGVVMQAVNFVNKSGSQPTTNHYGCTTYSNRKFPSENWIALVQRGECSFSQKIRTATKEHNASAIVIFNNMSVDIGLMQHDEASSSVAVYISRDYGEEIVKLIEKGNIVYLHLKPGEPGTVSNSPSNTISKTSVLFVSISFIVLMIVSLAWLVFYYIQRFRYSHAKERLARRLACAAKKAITRIPQRTIKMGDRELDSDYDQCAVCIEPYKFHDVIRTLPCRHVFHKSCVDPWLLDQRSCPMCKMDILRAYGMQIGSSQESLHPNLVMGHVTIVSQEEPEMSSSAESNQTDGAKVALVTQTCLHFYNASDKTGYSEQASDSLQGAVGGCIQSPASLNSKMINLSRAGRSDKADSVGSEIRALIGKGKEKSRRWKSEEACNDDDVDDDFDTTKDAVSTARNMDTSVVDVATRHMLQP